MPSQDLHNNKSGRFFVLMPSDRSWCTRYLLAHSPRPNRCPRCQRPVLMATGPSKYPVRIDPTPDAEGTYQAHRLSCPAGNAARNGQRASDGVRQ